MNDVEPDDDGGKGDVARGTDARRAAPAARGEAEPAVMDPPVAPKGAPRVSAAMEGRVNLLLVDDRPENLVVLESILTSPEYRLRKAQSAQEALVALLSEEFALIVLDVNMPGMNGIELAQAVKARKKTKDIAIIFLTAHSAEDAQILEGYEAGGVDFVTKPLNPAILKSKVSAFVELHRKNAALKEAVEALNREIASRARLEEELRRTNDALEARVRRRTQELEQANASLKLEMEERRLAAKEIEKLAAFPRFSPNLVLELLPGGKVNYANDAARAMAQALGFSDVREMLPSDAAEVVDHCIATGAARQRIDVVYGGRTITWSFFPVSAVHAVHGYGVEITERVQMEAQLRQAQKMESVGRLAAGVAHDFNNMLAVIQGYASLGETEAESSEVRHGLREISQAAERAANLTRQLLTFSRRQVIQPKSLDLNDVVRNFEQIIGTAVGESVSVQFSLMSGLPHVLLDQSMVECALLNLAVNAKDAMPKGGVVHIETTVEEIDEAEAGARAPDRPGRYVRLTFADSGVGIPPEHLSQIFEPFFTTKEVGKGTGLGLATVYGIVQQHAGWITVDSHLGIGTTFNIHLPVAQSRSAADEDAPPPHPRGGSETILVVEDEPALRSLVKRILENAGYSVALAENGTEALEIWRRSPDAYDLVLTDMVMPGGMGGRELAEKLHALKPDLRIIYSSGYSVDVAGEDLSLREDFNYLQKPYPPRRLLKIVRDCLDRV